MSGERGRRLRRGRALPRRRAAGDELRRRLDGDHLELRRRRAPGVLPGHDRRVRLRVGRAALRDEHDRLGGCGHGSCSPDFVACVDGTTLATCSSGFRRGRIAASTGSAASPTARPAAAAAPARCARRRCRRATATCSSRATETRAGSTARRRGCAESCPREESHRARARPSVTSRRRRRATRRAGSCTTATSEERSSPIVAATASAAATRTAAFASDGVANRNVKPNGQLPTRRGVDIRREIR